MPRKIDGIIPVMLTPFTEEGAIDYQGLERLTEWYIGHGSDVLFAGPVMPHAGTIERLVQGSIDGSLGAPLEALDPDVLALPARLDGHAVL